MLKNEVEGEVFSQKNSESILHYWLSAWNHAVEHNLDENFFIFFYEDMRGDNSATANDIATFLGTPCDFDMAGMVSRIGSYQDVLHQYNEAGIGYMLPLIDRLFPYDQWLMLAKTRMAQKKLCGYVLPIGKTIRLTADGDGWKYLYRGFYEPELDGTWTNGDCSTLLFTPDRDVQGSSNSHYDSYI